VQEARVSGPVLSQLNIVVSDMERSVAFYRRLGLEVADGPPEWQAHHRSATSPGSDLLIDLDSEAFASQWNTGRVGSGKPSGIVISFYVPTREAVDKIYGQLTEAGYRGQQAPYDAPWGKRFAVVEDPDGNPVGLMSPATDSARRPHSPPPSPAAK
jgi:catechol 2,3-dioxygenase-like lactoylglutathione lyase family enzyme